ncbi:hypothetical protein IAT38_006128 [Cryptococcus sp. DSM 104549]
MDIDDLRTDNAYQLGGFEDERERLQNAAVVEELERKKRLRKIAVPTDDSKVRQRLRAYGEPITLFGEGPGDRRDRLKFIQEQIEQARGDAGAVIDGASDSSVSNDDEDEVEFYTEGSEALLSARRDIAKYSLHRAKTRVARQKKDLALPLGKTVSYRKELFSHLQAFTSLGSQFGDDRPLSIIRFSPNSRLVLTAAWTGVTKVWDMPNLGLRTSKRGHSEKIGGAAWHPQATLNMSENGLNFATGGGEGAVKLWSLNGDQPLATLSGHQNRVGRLAFHPSGSYIGSAGFDGTWRLWDSATCTELLTQEGHSREVYALAFQDDGALAASGGFDAIGRIWDLRTGRTTMVLDGHVKEILAVDFAPNGYQVATGSGDDTVRIWDLRALRAQHIIPAHKSSVSDLRFFRASSDSCRSTIAGHNSVGSKAEEALDIDCSHDALESAHSSQLKRSGLYMVTASFDCSVRIWSSDEWAMVKNMPTNAGKIMSVDVAGSGQYIASASYSRSFHVFGNDQ